MHELCPVCSASEAHPVSISRGQTPVHVNRFYTTKKAAKAAQRGTLEIVACKACGFAWNRSFDANLVAYDGDYENDQTYSAEFHAHVKARAAEIVDSVPPPGLIDYLEVGCGQGGFIGEVAQTAAGRLRSAEGFDPAWRGVDATGPNGSRIHRAYFTAESLLQLGHAPNVVAWRHTIEHVPQPVVFLQAIRAALGPDSQARIFIETPCISWILQHQAFQDLFYEHCSIFSVQALRFALEAAGFGEVEVRHVFGGQYLWATGVASKDVVTSLLSPGDISTRGLVEQHMAVQWGATVAKAREAGPVAIWGAGGKGVTFALLTDPGSSFFDCAIDINPGKQNHYLACSGLEVLSPAAASERKLKTIFVMNPNYLNEIKFLADKAGIVAELVPIN